MSTKKELTYEQLQTEDCPTKGFVPGVKKHKVWLSMTGDSYPAFCSECGSFTNKVPPEVYEGM